jgi:SpoIIAA-like
VRLLYVRGEEFDSYTAGAVWADTKMFAGHAREWDKVAVVSDAEWLENSIKAFGWLMPGKVRVFDTDDVEDAVEWLTGAGSDGGDD